MHDCDRVRFDRVSILTPVDYPNNDGIHVNCSRDVTISNCIIETGDDCVIVRANSASLRENRPCERVCVVNCTFTKVPDTTPGYENWRQDGFSKGLRKPDAPEREHLKNVTFERCTFKDDSFKSVQP